MSLIFLVPEILKSTVSSIISCFKEHKPKWWKRMETYYIYIHANNSLYLVDTCYVPETKCAKHFIYPQCCYYYISADEETGSHGQDIMELIAKRQSTFFNPSIL